MDFTKLGAYITAIVGNTLGLLVFTHNLGDQTAQTISISVGAILNVLSVIFASHSGPKE